MTSDNIMNMIKNLLRWFGTGFDKLMDPWSFHVDFVMLLVSSFGLYLFLNLDPKSVLRSPYILSIIFFSLVILVSIGSMVKRIFYRWRERKNAKGLWFVQVSETEKAKRRQAEKRAKRARRIKRLREKKRIRFHEIKGEIRFGDEK